MQYVFTVWDTSTTADHDRCTPGHVYISYVLCVNNGIIAIARSIVKEICRKLVIDAASNTRTFELEHV